MYMLKHIYINVYSDVKLNVVNLEPVDLQCWTCDVNDTAQL